MQTLEQVAERLFEWFGAVPLDRIRQILREETADYQSRLRHGIDGPSAEHATFERLQRIVEAPAA